MKQDQLHKSDESDQGVVMVWVALMLVVLLGMAALVVDIGRLRVERRELQNGADAAALAVAQDCALTDDCGGDKGFERSEEYAKLNAKDWLAAAIPCGSPAPQLAPCSDFEPSGVEVEGASGWVRVETTTETADGDEVSFLFAPILGALGSTVSATAVAAWGNLGVGTTIPFTFSECEFNLMLGEDESFPEGETIVYSKDGGPKENPLPECESRTPSGGTVNGGFGWLTPNDGPCRVKLNIGATVTGAGDQGNDSEIKGCESLVQNKEVLLPLFSAATDPPNSTYTIAGFVGFIVTGYRLSGMTWPDKFSCPQVPDGTGQAKNLRCFRGEFTQYYGSQGKFAGRDSVDFGARLIKMVG